MCAETKATPQMSSSTPPDCRRTSYISAVADFYVFPLIEWDTPELCPSDKVAMFSNNFCLQRNRDVDASHACLQNVPPPRLNDPQTDPGQVVSRDAKFWIKSQGYAAKAPRSPLTTRDTPQSSSRVKVSSSRWMCDELRGERY